MKHADGHTHFMQSTNKMRV